MATGTDIQVTITPEAQAKIDGWGMRAEFERVLEQAKRIPGATHIAVDAPWIHAYQDDPIVFLEVYIPAQAQEPDLHQLEQDFFAWQRANFPIEVSVNFRLWAHLGSPHAG